MTVEEAERLPRPCPRDVAQEKGRKKEKGDDKKWGKAPRRNLGPMASRYLCRGTGGEFDFRREKKKGEGWDKKTFRGKRKPMQRKRASEKRKREAPLSSFSGNPQFGSSRYPVEPEKIRKGKAPRREKKKRPRCRQAV